MNLSPSLKALTMNLSLYSTGANFVPVTLLREAGFEPVTLSEWGGGGGVLAGLRFR
jgi:hypothetical protein